jgi:hypothetical protein
MFEFSGKPILDIVADRPIDEKPSSKPSCPTCGGTLLKDNGTWTTLVGGGTGPDDDPNHTWASFECLACSLRFTRETKQGNVWYTGGRETGVVVRGMPSCFERYTYACHCGGRISSRCLDRASGAVATIVTWSNEEDGEDLITTPSFVVFMSCDRCGKYEQCIEEYWLGARVEPRRGKKPSLKLDWIIKEEIGVCVINDYSISRVNIT